MLISVLDQFRKHFATRTRGQSLVEFALILPVFMVLFATTLDLGRLAVAQLSVTNAAREGAFQATKTPTDVDPAAPCPANGKTNLVICRVQLELKDSGVSVAPSDVAVACSVAGCPTGMGNRVTVNVTGHFQLLTPILAGFFGGHQNLAFTRSATMQIETLPAPPTSAPLATATPTPSPTPTAAPTATPTPNPSASPTPTPSPTPAPTPINCSLPSAGFTYGTSPKSGQSPLTVTVVDTTTSPACAITSWLWTWGDNTTSLQRDPGPHVYLVKGKYDITLTVANAAGSNTTGAVQVTVK